MDETVGMAHELDLDVRVAVAGLIGSALIGDVFSGFEIRFSPLENGFKGHPQTVGLRGGRVFLIVHGEVSRCETEYDVRLREWVDG